jgi:hypothetical protein
MAGIQDLAQYGRGNDSMIAHVTPGEQMIPPEMMARHPGLQKELYQAYEAEGMDPRQFKVGSGITSLNPTTGMPEYGFFKKLFKAAAPIVGYAMGGAAGAAIGGALAGASDGGGWKGALKGGAIGYVGGSLAAGGAFGNTIASNAGMGFGGGTGVPGLGSYGTKWSGGIGNWGSKGVESSIARNGGIGGAWKNLGGKLTSSPMLAMTALGLLTEEPDSGAGAPPTPNNDPGKPFKIDRPDLVDGAGDYKSNAITSATAGYGTGYKDHKAVNMPYETTAYVESPVIRPTELVIGNPNITPEEIMKYYKPVAYAATGGMINHGTTGTADDVPIMASKGEFVMTADAVRNAGQGDPRMGAKKLYDLMYSLEGAR